MTSKNEMCKRYGICKRIAMKAYETELAKANEKRKKIIENFNKKSIYNFVPGGMTTSGGFSYNNSIVLEQGKEAALKYALQSVRYPKQPSAEFIYSGNKSKPWRALRGPHKQTDIRKLTQEGLKEKMNKYGTVQTGHIQYPGGKIGLFNKRVSREL